MKVQSATYMLCRILTISFIAILVLADYPCMLLVAYVRIFVKRCSRQTLLHADWESV